MAAEKKLSPVTKKLVPCVWKDAKGNYYFGAELPLLAMKCILSNLNAGQNKKLTGILHLDWRMSPDTRLEVMDHDDSPFELCYISYFAAVTLTPLVYTDQSCNLEPSKMCNFMMAEDCPEAIRSALQAPFKSGSSHSPARERGSRSLWFNSACNSSASPTPLSLGSEDAGDVTQKSHQALETS